MRDRITSMGEQDIEQTVVTDTITEFHPGTVDNPFLFDADNAQLEKFLLTNMFVAGKNATVQQKKLDQFIDVVRRDIGSYAVDTMGVITAIHNAVSSVEFDDKVRGWLEEVKAGQYTRLVKGIKSLTDRIGAARFDLRTCTRENLVGINGIGYKTASMFLMYTRKNWRGACLDTHILKYLKEEIKLENVPAATPILKAEYERLETEFLKAVDAISRATNKSVAEIDFDIWSKYRVVPNK